MVSGETGQANRSLTIKGFGYQDQGFKSQLTYNGNA